MLNILEKLEQMSILEARNIFSCGNKNKSSWILRHYIPSHIDLTKEEVLFSLEVIKFCSGAFECHIQESIEIKRSMNEVGTLNLNNKWEYSRCVLPDLGASPMTKVLPWPRG